LNCVSHKPYATTDESSRHSTDSFRSRAEDLLVRLKEEGSNGERASRPTHLDYHPLHLTGGDRFHGRSPKRTSASSLFAYLVWERSFRNHRRSCFHPPKHALFRSSGCEVDVAFSFSKEAGATPANGGVGRNLTTTSSNTGGRFCFTSKGTPTLSSTSGGDAGNQRSHGLIIEAFADESIFLRGCRR